MAKLAFSVAVFLSLLFLFTFSSARDIQDPFSKPETETETHRGPETTHFDTKHQHDAVSVALTEPVPLRFISFRPINRHVARRPLPLSFRLGHHRCRHGHRIEIPYGNDAIVRSDAAVAVDRSGFDPANHGGVRQIPTRLVRLRGGEPRISVVRAHLHHQRHEHREEKGGFMKRIRMFLNLF